MDAYISGAKMLYNDAIAYSQEAIRYSGIQYVTVGIISSSSQEETNTITESNIIYSISASEINFSSSLINGLNSSESSITFDGSNAEISYIVEN